LVTTTGEEATVKVARDATDFVLLVSMSYGGVNYPLCYVVGDRQTYHRHKNTPAFGVFFCRLDYFLSSAVA
jgi:hypothetical protein